MSNFKPSQKMDKQMTWKQGILLNTILLLLGCFVTYGLTRSGKAIDKNDEVIKNKADISFVVDQDNQIKSKLNDHVISDDKRWEQLFIDVKGIKDQQNIIINELIKK